MLQNDLSMLLDTNRRSETGPKLSIWGRISWAVTSPEPLWMWMERCWWRGKSLSLLSCSLPSKLMLPYAQRKLTSPSYGLWARNMQNICRLMWLYNIIRAFACRQRGKCSPIAPSPPPAQGRQVVKRTASRPETGVHQGRPQNNIAPLTVPKSTLGSIIVKWRTVGTAGGLLSHRCELSEENEKEKWPKT